MTESNGYEVVERPGPRVYPGRPRGGLMQALRDTVESKTAVRVLRPNGRPIGGMYGSVLKAEGLIVHQRRDGDHIIVWAEKRTP